MQMVIVYASFMTIELMDRMCLIELLFQQMESIMFYDVSF